MPRFDLAVVGGGPAGASAAWHAARAGLAVALYESGGYPRDKVCGEFISAEARPLLQAMIPREVAAGVAVGSVEFFSRAGRAGGFRLPRAALGLSRRALDHALWQAAGRAGATLRPQTPVRALAELEAGAVIVAAGRWWKIDPLPAPHAAPWVGVKCHLRGIAPSGLQMHLFPGGYCGLAPVEGGLVNACCLVRRELLGKVREFLPWLRGAARQRALQAALAGATQAGDAVATAQVTPGPRAARRGAVLLAGDAAGFLDPFAGDGIARALAAGRLAALAIAAGDAAAYDAALRHSARGWRLAALLRGLVRAPATPQAAALALLVRAPLARALYRATRWHD